MISLALFDISTEDLIQELLQAGWSFEDVLAYADDQLVICNSIEEVESAIKIINTWYSKVNISLNPQKSGILEIIPARHNPSLPMGSFVQGIPIVHSYRYLGLLFGQKLNGETQFKAMLQKINFLTNRLAPLLSKVSADYRINLWKALVRPLFNPSLAIACYSNKSRIQQLERSLKGSFKRFVGLSISTSDVVLDKLIDFKRLSLARDQQKRAFSKWSQRLRKCPNIQRPQKEVKITPFLPKVFLKFNNIQKTECLLCNTKERTVDDINSDTFLILISSQTK